MDNPHRVFVVLLSPQCFLGRSSAEYLKQSSNSKQLLSPPIPLQPGIDKCSYRNQLLQGKQKGCNIYYKAWGTSWDKESKLKIKTMACMPAASPSLVDKPLPETYRCLVLEC